MKSDVLVVRGLFAGVLMLFAGCATPGGGTTAAPTGNAIGTKPPAAQPTTAPESAPAKSVAVPSAKKPFTVRFDGVPVMGDRHAPVAVIEFGDFQSRPCRFYHRMTFQAIKHEYMDQGQIQYMYRDFPLPSHKLGFSAAIATHCAGVQGAYWAMLHELYDDPGRLGPKLYMKYAKFFRLRNVPRFKRCLTDGSQDAAVNANIQYGHTLDVDTVPTFFIGRVDGDHIIDVKTLRGAQPLRVFEKAIDAALKTDG